MLQTRERPAVLLGLDVKNDEYTAFCFDEAVAYIISELKDGKKPNFGEAQISGKHYSKVSDLYRDIEGA